MSCSFNVPFAGVCLSGPHTTTQVGFACWQGKLVHFKLASVAFLFGSCPAAKAELMIVFHFTLARSFSVYHRLNELSVMFPHSCGYYALIPCRGVCTVYATCRCAAQISWAEWSILKCSFHFHCFTLICSTL